MTLLDRHLEFVETLRTAGLPVSVAEGLDAVRAVERLGLGDRERMREGYAATLVKRQAHRPSFDAVFDLFFPALLGSGARWTEADRADLDSPEAVTDLRDRLATALVEVDADQAGLGDLAVELVERLGELPGRGKGMSTWSAHQALSRVGAEALLDRLVAALAGGGDRDEARRAAERRFASFARLVDAEVRRRLAEDRTPQYVAETILRPPVDQIAFTAARMADVEQMRREIYPLARRLATRLAKEQHARRRGPLDFRRTVRASMSTGGVPVTTHHRPRRPHRSELVVLCDVSGSVAQFAQFTLLLVFALREQFTKVRAFTFVDDVHEVTQHFRPGGDPASTMAELAASVAHASRWGRTDYGRAFTRFQERHADALGPKVSLLVLGDARSNYGDLALPLFAHIVRQTRHAYWLNPEHRRQWGTGDSGADRYAGEVRMVECRNLAQLSDFVHDIV
jgi:uncharacterized protein